MAKNAGIISGLHRFFSIRLYCRSARSSCCQAAPARSFPGLRYSKKEIGLPFRKVYLFFVWYQGILLLPELLYSWQAVS